MASQGCVAEVCQEVTTASFTSSSSSPDEEVLKYMKTPYGYQLAYLAVGAVGMVGNLMVVVVVLSSASLRSTFTNKFIINQSLIDFSSSFFIITTNILDESAPEVLGDGFAQDLYCIIWLTKWPMWGTFICSTFNLVALSFERYLGILYPLQHKHRFTTKKAYVIMVMVWMVGLGFQGSYIVATTRRENNVCKTYQYPSIFVQRAMGVVFMLVQYTIPLIVITFAYISIFLALRRTSKSMTDKQTTDQRENRMRRAQRNVIRTLFKIFACFVCCWTPNQLFYAAYNFGHEFTDDVNYYHCSVLMIFCNACINPFVYTLTYEQFKDAQRRAFIGWWGCKKPGGADGTSTSSSAGSMSTEVSA